MRYFSRGVLIAALAGCGVAFGDGGALGDRPLPEFPEWSVPRRVTEGPHEHLLANYFGINAWSPDNRYLLVLETDVNGRLPNAGERCVIGLVDLETVRSAVERGPYPLETAHSQPHSFRPVATTCCWNFQEAAMAHWLDNDTFVFNDLRGGRFVAVVKNWKTGAERLLPHPVAAVSEDGAWAVSYNYARLYLTRPDYGYAGGGQNPQTDEEWPTDDGLWTMDMTTGESKLILSIADARALMPPTKREAGKPGRPLAHFCHAVISKDGAKIFFLARSVNWFDAEKHVAGARTTTSFTIDRDGGNLRKCFPDGWGGSHFNWAPDGSHKLLVTALWDADKTTVRPARTMTSAVEFMVGEEEKVRRIGGGGILDLDWHCLYSPDGEFMSGETYYDQNFERPWVLVRLADGMTKPMGSFWVPERYRGSKWRCDLHARYRPDGRQIAFNSVHEGSRQVYVRDITTKRTPSLTYHIDLKEAVRTKEVILDQLRFAAEKGYDSILWEVEDKVRFETCPEAAHPEAFTKEEFRQILAEAKRLRLRPIPLLQTFGHAEYVLKNARYAGWREQADNETCYCVSKPEVRAFLKKWIDEMLELFGPEVREFHLGGDEARVFATCSVCAARNRRELYAEHLNELAGALRARGIRPGVWSDMLLSEAEASVRLILPRDFILWHWDYTIGAEKPTPYTANLPVALRAGYDVRFAGAAESSGDDPFLGRRAYHAANLAAAADEVRTNGLYGLCVTSWSVRRVPKTVQRPLVDFAARRLRDPAPRAAEDLAASEAEFLSRGGERLADWLKKGAALKAAYDRAMSERGVASGKPMSLSADEISGYFRLEETFGSAKATAEAMRTKMQK